MICSTAKLKIMRKKVPIQSVSYCLLVLKEIHLLRLYNLRRIPIHCQNSLLIFLHQKKEWDLNDLREHSYYIDMYVDQFVSLLTFYISCSYCSL